MMVECTQPRQLVAMLSLAKIIRLLRMHQLVNGGPPTDRHCAALSDLRTVV
jgi:hypothetical protein